MKKIAFESLTFDDVLLVPRRSSVLPSDVDTTGRLTKTILLKTPIASAAMDSVTEIDMAIGMAREGGIGIIHKNLSIDQQVDMIDRVKRSESGMIQDPITLSPSASLKDALELMSRYSISGIPVIASENNKKKLMGIITNRDLRFQEDHSKTIDSVMTKENLITAKEKTSLHEAEKILLSKKIEKLLIVDENKDLKGLITFKDIEKNRKHPNATKDSYGRLRVGAAVGIKQDTLERVMRLYEKNVDIIAVDTAHGHSDRVITMVERIKQKFPSLEIIAGNVATPEAVYDLQLAGADCIKVGIGPGSICTTRVIAGVGVPQLSAILMCYEESQKHGIPIMADGGIKYSGDLAKALAAGADSVMIGGLLSGTTESPGKTEIFEGRKYKTYRGMGSLGAMSDGSSDRYFQDHEKKSEKFVPEGVEGRVPYKGSLGEVVYQLVGGIRSSMGYCGVKTISEFQSKSVFSRITNAGLRESHPHDVLITNEAPNYSLNKLI